MIVFGADACLAPLADKQSIAILQGRHQPRAEFWATQSSGSRLTNFARGATPPIHIPFFFEAAILSRIRSPVTSRSNYANDNRTFKVNRPMRANDFAERGVFRGAEILVDKSKQLLAKCFF